MEVALNTDCCTRSFVVNEVAHVDAVRRATIRQAEAQGFDEDALGRLTIVVQEMARNLVNHAGEGEILLNGDGGTLDVLAVDRGPGMVNVAQCMADSYSSKGTMGAGLGAIKRLSDSFDIYSQPGQGTVVLARFQLEKSPPSALISGALCLPHPKEELCGDAWAIRDNRVMLCDGLGHGPQANEASQRARRLFLEHDPKIGLVELMERTHHALQSTRGGALAFAEVDVEQGQVTFCGVGNIAGALYAEQSRGMVSSNGTVGYKVGRVQTFSYPWDEHTLLIMSSDGITTKSSLNPYPGIRARHPALVAGAIMRDFRRLNDDATVVVLRHA